MKATIEIHDDDSITVKHGDTVVSATPPVSVAGQPALITYPWSNERHWQPGDRRPSQGEMTLYGPIGWFDGMPDTSVDLNQGGADTDNHIAYHGDGEYAVKEGRNRISGVPETAKLFYKLPRFALGKQVSVALASGHDGNCAGDFAISPVPGPVVGDQIVQALSGNTAALAYTEGPNNTGMPVAQPGVDHWANAHYSRASPDQLVDVQAH